MHGRRRLPPGAEPLMDEENKKAAKVHALVQAALQSRKRGQTPPPIIAATNAVLARNPEVYSLWNLKREVLHPIVASPEGAAEAAKEMQLVEQCLQKNHKSYAAWHQRQWLVEHGHIDKFQDLRAVERHLNQVHGDPKNFHAWKYRSWLIEQLNLPPSADLEFTEGLLRADPSNFSAWHMRMVALSADHSSSAEAISHLQTGTQLPAGDGTRLQGNEGSKAVAAVARGVCQPPSNAKHAAAPVPQRTGTRALPLAFTAIEQELKLLHELVAVDPANSSCWSFHRWLLHCACCDIECPSAQHAATVPTAAADPVSSEGGIPAAERRERAKVLLRDERSMCGGIAQAEAARVEALAAEGGEVPDGGTERVTVSLARMAHMRALQAEADVLALQQRLAVSEGDEAVAAEAARGVLRQLQAADSGRAALYDSQAAALCHAA